jgi:glycosyltransferase involved in cell wall biosynthesis
VALRQFDSILRRASLRLGISQAMCDAYQARYGYEFIAFHNALDMDRWLPPSRRSWTTNTPARVCYIGSIVSAAQRDSLQDICKVVADLHASGMAIEAWVHAPAQQTDYLRRDQRLRDTTRTPPPPDPARIPSLMAEADVLALPYNFDAYSATYIRLSMPTKIPAYMVSGTPVLVYGPPDAAAVRYAIDTHWGAVVAERDHDALARTIRALVTDADLRQALGKRAQALAVQNHDAARVRPRFWRALVGAAHGSAPD